MSDREKNKRGILKKYKKRKLIVSQMQRQNSATTNIFIKKTKKTCSFCGGNHVISQCNIKSNLGKEWSGIQLRKYLLLEAPYSILDHQDMNSIINDDIDCSRMSQNIKFHLFNSRTKASLLNNDGLVLE